MAIFHKPHSLHSATGILNRNFAIANISRGSRSIGYSDAA